MINYERFMNMTMKEFCEWLNEDEKVVEQTDCPYCHLDSDLQCSMESFASPDDDIEISLSCGGAEVAILFKNKSSNDVVGLVTSAKYCPYCGRRIVL